MTLSERGEDEPSAASPGSAGSARRVLPFSIVGIAASGGGVEAVTQLVQALRKDTGMAFVFLLHLPAGHESMLAEILGRVSPVPVTTVSDRVTIEPDHAYVVPAGADLAVEEGRLVLTPRTASRGRHHSIDHFFRSLAECQAERAIGVLLSGCASDGTSGIQEIKAAGGITFAQDGTAQSTEMPRSAIATGTVDFVLPPAEIARELGRIAGHPFIAAARAADDERLPDIRPILDLLRQHAGVDFSEYKPNTLYRRIARRIGLKKLDGVSEYLRLLRASPSEVEALYQDVLVNVTSFFRNPEAFEVLKQEVFPVLTRDRSRHDPVRIWTPGCSTGEEAYSLAMAFSEFCESLGRIIPLQVFATDLNAASIDKARMGTYARSALEGLSAERLCRFFVEMDGHYRIEKTIRDACVFARHNVISDPPFSRVDLVSCRNMLIYIGAELQQKILPVLHYALRERGFLWLGTSETIGSARDLFDIVDARYKVYAKKGAAVRPILPLPAVRPAPPGNRAVHRMPDAPLAPGDPQTDIATREYLQSVIDEQEAANEALQAANEEVQSTNEELQSINEELETSKREVQSSNEELATVNDELHARNVELARSNNDLVNLLASVQMAIVMLGPDLRIRRFTPMAEKLLNLIPTDVGRLLGDIKWNFEVSDLASLVEEVIDSTTTHEREVRDRGGRWHLLRIQPYRTPENRIDGAVVVLIDVDSLKRSEETLRQQTASIDDLNRVLARRADHNPGRQSS